MATTNLAVAKQQGLVSMREGTYACCGAKPSDNTGHAPYCHTRTMSDPIQEFDTPCGSCGRRSCYGCDARYTRMS